MIWRDFDITLHAFTLQIKDPPFWSKVLLQGITSKDHIFQKQFTCFSLLKVPRRWKILGPKRHEDKDSSWSVPIRNCSLPFAHKCSIGHDFHPHVQCRLDSAGLCLLFFRNPVMVYLIRIHSVVAALPPLVFVHNARYCSGCSVRANAMTNADYGVEEKVFLRLSSFP